MPAMQTGARFSAIASIELIEKYLLFVQNLDQLRTMDSRLTREMKQNYTKTLRDRAKMVTTAI